jgi:hypothetical protein
MAIRKTRNHDKLRDFIGERHLTGPGSLLMFKNISGSGVQVTGVT